jgi:hypothetical protein
MADFCVKSHSDSNFCIKGLLGISMGGDIHLTYLALTDHSRIYFSSTMSPVYSAGWIFMYQEPNRLGLIPSHTGNQGPNSDLKQDIQGIVLCFYFIIFNFIFTLT